MKKIIFTFFICQIALFGKELTLDDAVEMAYKENKEIKKAVIDYDISELEVDNAIYTGLPKLTYEGTWVDTENNAAKGYNNQLVLTQPIFMGGKVIEAIKISKDVNDLTSIQLKKTKKVVRMEVIEAYGELKKLHKQKKIIDDAIKEIQENLAKVRRLYKLGYVIKTDVLDLELQELVLNNEKITLLNGIKIKTIQLNNLIGLKADTELELTETLSTRVDNIEIDVDNDLEKGKIENVDLKIVKILTKVEEANEVVSRAKLLPEVAFQGKYGNGDGQFFDKYSDSLDDKNLNWSVGVSFKWEAFDWGSNWNDHKINKMKTQKAKYDEKITNEHIEVAIRAAYLEVDKNMKLVKTAKKAVVNAKENYRLQQKKFQAQMITATDFLSAQNNLNKSNIELVNAEIDLYLSYEKYIDLIK